MRVGDETQKIDQVPTNGLLGVTDSLSYLADKVNHHFHAYERWMGAAAVPNGEIHVADSVNTSKAAFRVTSGNDTWGNWLQILGSSDTPIDVGEVVYDPHRIVITAFGVNNAVHAIQVAAGTSGAAALTAGTYSEMIIKTGTGLTVVYPSDLRIEGQPAGTKLWIRNWSHGNTNDTLDFFLGLHEYEG